MLLEIVSSIFDAIILYIYFREMLGKRRDSISFAIYLLFFSLAELFLIALSIYFSDNYSSTKLYITTSLSLLITFGLSFLHDCKIRHRIFAVISFQVYAAVAETVVYLLFTLLSNSISTNLLQNSDYGLTISKIILFMMLDLTILLHKRKRQPIPNTYTLLVLIMPILSIILLMTIPGAQSLDSTQIVLSLFGTVGVLIANIANYFLLENILRYNELSRTSTQLNQQLIYQANKYQQISTAYRKSRSLIHDTKKHFFFIRDGIENKEYSSVLSYLEKALERMENSYNRINTGNLVIDALVSNHLAIAEQENIQFCSDIQIAKERIVIEDYDLCIILGNLLDNSLEACRKVLSPKPRQISLQIFTTEQEFVIHIYNSFNDSTLITSGEDKDELVHGYGTKNIETVTLKYLGNYSHFVDKGYYHAIVSTPNID